MPDPDKTDPNGLSAVQTDNSGLRKTEIDLEFEQRARLLDAFSLIGTYDAREAVIKVCEKQAKSKR